ncbi:MAG: type IIA DNA topoisomerase subunit B [Opitutales bacterium]|nr:type IIA DNA topoisomerase subunit B [Opitutales bacterium]NRA26452.1 type IIA DNA topoisomerase subunit B [Opitutales bacterium]
MADAVTYTEDNIRSLKWNEHIQLRPGMYIGKLGNGSQPDDGVYVLLKEIIDNSIDEHMMGHGKRIDVDVASDGTVTVRDYGRGIPLGKVVDCVSQINTGGKYDSKAFKKSVGMNGVGTKAVNALSSWFKVESFRDGKSRSAAFAGGEITEEDKQDQQSAEKNGTRFSYRASDDIFRDYKYELSFIEERLRHYACLNTGLKLFLNGKEFSSKNGLLDLLSEKLGSEEPAIYAPIHLKGEDIELAITHAGHYGEDYYSFVNGQYTSQGGTHEAAFRQAYVKTIREFFKKDFDAKDIRTSITAAIAIKVSEPVFESQTKTKLGSTEMEPDGQSLNAFISGFISKELDNYLHRNPAVAEELQKKIVQNEKERTALKGIQKLARERAKKAKINNRKLRDCTIHYTDTKDARAEDTTLFITEGDSASGSITASRDVHTQAVFGLKGKPLNAFGLTKKVVYENEEFNLLQHALDIEDSLDSLRYNRVVIATDADVDGFHIRMLLITFFLQFFPDLVRRGHLYILQTPLFRVRNKKETIYCYSDAERKVAVDKLGANPEITRFKGLGEIDPSEFKNFIGWDMRLDLVHIGHDSKIKETVAFFMGKNTEDRKRYTMDHLRIEKNGVDDEAVA